MTRCAIYIRKSRKDSDQRAYRLEYQREFLPQYAKSQGWSYEVFDEGITSASDIKLLPKLQEILSRLKDFEGILTIDPTRISRDASAQDYIWFLAQCTKAGIKLVTPQSNINLLDPNQWFQASLNAILSAKEMKDLSKRTKEAKQKMKDQGKYLGGVIPYGYNYNQLSKELTLNKKEAKIVRQILESVVDRSMAQTVLRYSKVKGKWGAPISVQWLMRLSSESRLYFYSGMRKNNAGDYIPTQHPAIISDKLREAVLQAKSRRRREGAGFFGNTTLFGGLKILKCGYCGSAVVVKYIRQKAGYVDKYYVCVSKSQLRPEKRCKEGRYYRRERVDELLTADLIKTIQNRTLLEEAYREALTLKKPNSERAKNLSDQFEKEETRKRSLIKALGRFKRDEEIISELETVTQQIHKLQQELDQFRLPQKLPFSLEDMVRIAKRIEEFRNFSRDKKREIIKTVIKRVSFFREYLEVFYTFPINPHKIRFSSIGRKGNT